MRVADDLVQRQFRPAPTNVLWIADVTYLRTWEGWLERRAHRDEPAQFRTELLERNTALTEQIQKVSALSQEVHRAT